MGEQKKPKPGGSKLIGGFLWAFTQLGLEWFVLNPAGSMFSAFSAAASGFVAGWVTTGVLNLLARWGASGKALFGLGAVIGLAVVSGAFQGLLAAKNWIDKKDVAIDWEKLQAFLMDWRAVLPVAVLGALIGLYVRSKTPPPAKKK